MSQYESRISQLSGARNEMRVIEGKNHFEIERPTYDQQIVTWLDEFLSKIALSVENECVEKNENE